MAYAASITITRIHTARGRGYRVLVTETEASSTSEWNTGNVTADAAGRKITLPTQGRIVLRKVYKTTGTASSVAPVYAKATGITAAGVDAIAVTSAATSVDDGTSIPFSLPGGVLYGRSTPDAGSDNGITTEIVIIEGGA